MVTGTITDEGVERLRSRIGVPQLCPAPPCYRRPGAATIERFAREQ